MLHTGSTLQELLQSVIEIVNKAENPTMTSGGGIDEYQLFQKMEELRRSVEHLGVEMAGLHQHEALKQMGSNLEAIALMLTRILEGDDDRLMERLKAKVKATYADERGMLVEFVQWAEKQEADFAEGLVDRFLEEVGDT